MKNNELNGNGPGYLLLLPRWFRWVGLGLFVLIFILGLWKKEWQEMLSIPKAWMAYILKSGLVLAALFVSCARRKIEDERSLYLRFQAISHAAVLTGVIVLIYPLGKVISDRAITMEAWNIVFILFLCYWLSAEVWLKFGFPYEKHDQSRKG